MNFDDIYDATISCNSYTGNNTTNHDDKFSENPIVENNIATNDDVRNASTLNDKSYFELLNSVGQKSVNNEFTKSEVTSESIDSSDIFTKNSSDLFKNPKISKQINFERVRIRGKTNDSIFSQPPFTNDIYSELCFEDSQSFLKNKGSPSNQECSFFLPEDSTCDESNAKIEYITKDSGNNNTYDAPQYLSANPAINTETNSENSLIKCEDLQKTFSFENLELTCKINISFAQKGKCKLDNKQKRPSRSSLNKGSLINETVEIDPIIFHDNIDNTLPSNSSIISDFPSRSKSKDLEEWCFQLDSKKDSKMKCHNHCNSQSTTIFNEEEFNTQNISADHFFINKIHSIQSSDNNFTVNHIEDDELKSLNDFNDYLIKDDKNRNPDFSPEEIFKSGDKIQNAVTSKSLKGAQTRKHSKRLVSADKNLISKTSDEKLPKRSSISEKMFHCESKECDKTFNRKEHAKRHFFNVHSGDKPWKCDVCKQNFSRKDNMLQHQKIHFKKRRQ